MDLRHLSFFDKSRPLDVVDRRLPHWIQQGTLCFVTWRLNDSLPVSVCDRLDAQIREYLNGQGIDPKLELDLAIQALPPSARKKAHWDLFIIRDRFLDVGAGECVLGREELGKLAISSLLYFNEDRYLLTDVVIMPNHLHYIAAFPSPEGFLKQNTNLKRYIARIIHKQLGRTGDFWQVDQFDHLIRNESQFQRYRDYIRENPNRAGLRPGEFQWFSKDLICQGE